MPSNELSKPTIAAWQLELRAALFDAVRPGDIRDIMAAIVTKAKKGDLKAADFLFRYAVGSPTIRDVTPGPNDPSPEEIREAALKIRQARNPGVTTP